MQGKRVLITGGAGFIGSNLARNLCRDNQVTIIDDLSSGRLENLSDIASQINFIQGSITQIDLLEKSLRGIELVYHLAAIASVTESIQNPILVNDINATGTLNLLVAARNNKVKKFVFASSAAVYGNPITLPVKETDPPNPQSPYAITKLAGEYYCTIFHQLYGLSTTSLRYFNVFGPQQNMNSQYGSVIPIFISKIQQGKQPVIYGDGNQIRDFVFVDDLIRANVMASQNNLTGVFNVGSGKGTTINELARTIMGIWGKELPPKYEKAKAGDITNSVADISKAKVMGYEPVYTLGKGLQEMIRSTNYHADTND